MPNILSASGSPPRHIRDQLKKLEAHAEHLLDGILWLKERHAMFRPMLDKQVLDSRGASRKRHGFMTIRRTLFFSCVLDIANLCLDGDDRTSSITNIVRMLTRDPLLLSELRRKYSVWVSSHTAEEQADPDVMRSIRALEQENAAKRAAEFDQRYEHLLVLWESLQPEKTLLAFKEMRDKLLAHPGLIYEDRKHKPLDIGKMGLRWDDIGAMIDRMQGVTEAIGHVARAASFAWDHADEQHQRHAREYWAVDVEHTIVEEGTRSS